MDFVWHNPVKIVFGDKINELKDLCPKDKQIFMTYGGGSIKRNGVYDQVMAALSEHTVKEFGGIEANPDFDTLMKIVEAIKEVGADNVFLLAVGGGSILDGTKFIAAASRYTHSEDKWEILETGGKYVTEAVSFGAVLTLPATGSEMNSNGVISRRTHGLKLPFGSKVTFPVFSILNPEVTLTLSTRQTRNGVVDAIVHIMEQYLTYPNPMAAVQDVFAEGLLKVLVKNGKAVIADPKDMVARTNIMWAATHALSYILATGVPQDWTTHMIGHELTATLGLDHAQTLAIVQAPFLRYLFDQKSAKLAQMGEQVFGITEGSVKEKAEKCIESIEKFYREDLGQMTHISEYIEDYTAEKHAETTKTIVSTFVSRDAKLGEKKNVLPTDVEAILSKCM
eukprot:TRINITY_DN1043_c0_g1_i1.p1 TRINITY_DN1043_c0_g1~~TRINITY_DN1043_c0_g1_i1.p1  ORF type:complete len:410 (-),score=125.40 TRINITY_DN1043_c0_g1_i1:184-1368(-)